MQAPLSRLSKGGIRTEWRLQRLTCRLAIKGQGHDGAARHDNLVALVDSPHLTLDQVEPIFHPFALNSTTDTSNVAHNVGAAQVGRQTHQESVIAHPIGDVPAEP